MVIVDRARTLLAARIMLRPPSERVGDLSTPVGTAAQRIFATCGADVGDRRTCRGRSVRDDLALGHHDDPVAAARRDATSWVVRTDYRVPLRGDRSALRSAQPWPVNRAPGRFIEPRKKRRAGADEVLRVLSPEIAGRSMAL